MDGEIEGERSESELADRLYNVVEAICGVPKAFRARGS